MVMVMRGKVCCAAQYHKHAYLLARIDRFLLTVRLSGSSKSEERDFVFATILASGQDLSRHCTCIRFLEHDWISNSRSSQHVHCLRAMPCQRLLLAHTILRFRCCFLIHIRSHEHNGLKHRQWGKAASLVSFELCIMRLCHCIHPNPMQICLHVRTEAHALSSKLYDLLLSCRRHHLDDLPDLGFCCTRTWVRSAEV